MKAAAFEYLRATSVAHACALLARHGPEARLIAGGQSLVPMMAMRLARPAWLIDLQSVDELKTLRIEADHALTGAGLRQCEAEASDALAAAVPLIRQALAWVGHVQTKNRGTLGGSLVHADPSAELPLVARTLGARMTLASAGGTREVDAAGFFVAPLASAVEAHECLTMIRWPRWAGRVGCAFDEVSVRHGDYAIVAACAQVALDAGGRSTRVALGVGGASGTPLRLDAVCEALTGGALDDAAIDAALADIGDRLEPSSDLQATAEYRIHLARVLAARVLRAARDQALRT